jgi:hypothetical protein
MDHIIVLYPVEPLYKLFGPIISSIQIQMRIWVFPSRFNSIIILGIIPFAKIAYLDIENPPEHFTHFLHLFKVKSNSSSFASYSVVFKHLANSKFLLGTLCYLTVVPLYQVVWNILSPNDHLYHDLVKNLLATLTQVQNYQLHLTQILLSIFDYPIQQYDIEVFPYQDHGEEVEEKTRS